MWFAVIVQAGAIAVISVAGIRMFRRKSGQQPSANVVHYAGMHPAQLLMNALRTDDVESVGFLNDLVAHMWPFINTAVSRTVKSTVEPLFEEVLPSPFKSTEFRKIDLGSVPIKFDNANVVRSSVTSARLDIDVHWDGKCDIELHSPLVGEYGVESVKLKGRVSVILGPLFPTLPVIGGIHVSFVNPPFIDVDFTGIVDVADFAILRRCIRKIISNVVNSIIVLPNRLYVPIIPHDSTDDDGNSAPIGFIRITIVRGYGFKTTGHLMMKDIPDVYIQVGLGTHELERCDTVRNSCEPEWTDQSFDFLLSDPQQMIRLQAWDDDLTRDDSLGGAIFPVQYLLESEGNQREIALQSNDGPTGAHVVVHGELRTFSGESSTFDTTAKADTKTDGRSKRIGIGLLTVIVFNAIGLPTDSEKRAFCRVLVGDEYKFRAPAIVNGPLVNPINTVFNATFRAAITNEMLENGRSVVIELCAGSDTLGGFKVSIEDILSSTGMLLRKSARMECGANLNVSLRLVCCV